MPNYATLKAAIQTAIKQNGNNEITGALLQQSLLTMINSLGVGYQFMGVATPLINPGTPDQNVFYLAFEAGTYVNFAGTVLAGGKIGVFSYNGTWNCIQETVVDIVNNLTSGGTDKALSAEQGKNLLSLLEKYALQQTPYLLPDSTFTGDIDAIQMACFILDFKLKVTKESGYKYGIYKLNNGLPEGVSYSYSLFITKYPENESPTQLNQTVVRSINFGSSKPNNGLYEDNYCYILLNWDALPNAFGGGSYGDGTGFGLRYNQEYIFDLTTGIIAQHRQGEQIAQNTEDIAELEQSVEDITTTKITCQIAGEIDYYSQYNSGYAARGVCQRTPAKPTAYKVNHIKIGPVRGRDLIAGQTIEINYSIRQGVQLDGQTPPANIIKSGTITIDNTYRSFDIYLDNDVGIAANNSLLVYFYPNVNMYLQILGKSGNDGVTPYSGSQTVIFTTSFSSSMMTQNWSIGNANYLACAPVCYQDSLIDVTMRQLFSGYENYIIAEIINSEEFTAAIEAAVQQYRKPINVHLPNKIYAVVGDRLQLFYRGIVEAVNPYNYDIDVRCSKGNAYPRYFDYLPTADDIGSVDLTINVRDETGAILGTKTCVLQTVAAPVSPATTKKIFTFGDSLTSHGKWCNEANRRLTKTNAVDGIYGKGLSNIVFCGSREITANETTTKYFGVGGWTWNTYVVAGTIQYRVYVSGVSSVSVGAVYSNNGNNYTVAEVNITDGSGNMLLTGQNAAPQSSGTLTKVSGNGDTTITYSSYEQENTNPLWNVQNNQMSFVPYVTEYGNGNMDVAYVLLTWNSQYAWKKYTLNDTTLFNSVKTFARTFHTEYPNAKLKIMGIQMPSLNGGLGANYGADGQYSDCFGLCSCAFSYNKTLQDFCNETEFAPYCEYVDIAAQFDSENNMPYSTRPVNVRNSNTEIRGTNGVHPADAGYYQIADAVYRNFVANFCQ